MAGNPANISGWVVRAAARILRLPAPGKKRTPLDQRLRTLVARALEETFDHPQDARNLAAARSPRASPRFRPPPGFAAWLLARMGRLALRQWLSTRLSRITPEEAGTLTERWTAAVLEGSWPPLFQAASRIAVEAAEAGDGQIVETSFQENVKEQNMNVVYSIDLRGTPPGFNAEPYTEDFKAILLDRFGLAENTDEEKATAATIIGATLLKEQFDTTTGDFLNAVKEAWNQSLDTTKDYSGNAASNRKMYLSILEAISCLPGRTVSGSTAVFYQELAYTAQYVIENAASVPLGHPNFATQVRLGLDRYVGGLPPTDSLTLPPLTGEGGVDVEIEGSNIESVAVIYVTHQLERMRLLSVVDRITELFMNGLVAIGYDAGGRLLDKYYWDAEDRLKLSDRMSIYSRVLGVPGGDVSKEVQPNRDFENLLLRFISSLAEYDRQRRVADLFESNRGASLRMSSEAVRKSGRDLAANASLYGWGGTQFAARKLRTHVATAFEILKNTSIQRVYGVTNPYQVVERVAQAEFGQNPNIVQCRTLADAGKGILNLIAQYKSAWSTASEKPLFSELERNAQGYLAPTLSDIPDADRDKLLLHAQNWIAVKGVASDQVLKMSEPADTPYAPSVPSFGAAPAKNGQAGTDVMDRLRQMVSSGSTPSLDQLQQLLRT
jgi:hypothetical protein